MIHRMTRKPIKFTVSHFLTIRNEIRNKKIIFNYEEMIRMSSERKKKIGV